MMDEWSHRDQTPRADKDKAEMAAQRAEMKRRAEAAHKEQVGELAELLTDFAVRCGAINKIHSEEMAEKLISLGWDRDVY